MTIMVLSKSRLNLRKPKQLLYCPIRQEWVTAFPEEYVRQHLIQQMTEHLGFPLSCIAVEKALQQMPHLSGAKHHLPLRRADIICFSKGIHAQFDLYPLLLIECKAVPLTETVIRQVVGYNYYLHAYFIAIANQQEVRVGCIDARKNQYRFTSGLPHYQHLLNALTMRTA